MESLKYLNKKEIKHILEILSTQFGFEEELDYEFLLRTKDDRVFLINRDVRRVDDRKIRVNAIGLYFGELKKNTIRLSIEGSQIVGPYATKNVLKIPDVEVAPWIEGEDLTVDSPLAGIVIITNGRDYMGCGSIKQGIVLNQIPKIRRVNTCIDCSQLDELGSVGPEE